MSAAQNSDSSGEVVQTSLRTGARVNADEEAADLAKPLLDERGKLKTSMRSRQDAHDLLLIEDGKSTTFEAKTDRELVAFGQRVAGRFVTGKTPGEQHPVYLRLMDGKAPSALLPAKREPRSKAIEDLKRRVEARETPSEVKKDGADLLKAIVAEQKGIVARGVAQQTYDKAQKAEEDQKQRVVVAGRALAGAVQSRFADSPARVRALLGHSTGGKKAGKKKADEPGKPGDKAPVPG